MKYKWWFFGLLLLLISFIFDNIIITYIVDNRVFEWNEAIAVFSRYTNGFFSLIVAGLIILIWKRKEIYRFIIGYGVFAGLIWLLKNTVNRPRPYLDLDIVNLLPNEQGYSFPSGHASFAFFTLSFMWRFFPKFKWLWLILAILISLSRVYTGVHYFSDIVAGMLLGLFFGFLFLKQKLFKFKKRG